MTNLFRKEVIERQTNRLHGDVLVLPRLSHLLLISLLLTWVALVLVWLVSSKYARKETALGWLEPSEGVTRIYAEDSGLIQQVLVQEGEKVEAGQPLIIVNNDRHLAGGDALESRLLSEYATQQRLLTQQLENSTRIYQQRWQELNRNLSTEEQHLALLDAQLATLDEHHRLVREQVKRNQSLRERQFISQSDLDTVRTQELSLRNERQTLLREQAQLVSNLDSLRLELNILPEEKANEHLQLRARLSDLVQQVAQLQAQHTYVIKAPRPGLVNNLQADVGARVYANHNNPLLTLLPEDDHLQAELLVSVRSAGFLEKGQALNIRYDAFPYQKFGLYPGEIKNMTGSVLMPSELSGKPISTEEPVFHVTASLQQPSVHAYGRDFDLKPGMTLSADIRLGERNLLQWLLEPIYSLRGRL